MVDYGKTTPRNVALRHFPIKTSGIYQIRNRTDGKVYIGSAANMRRRLRIHLLTLRKGNHISPHLQRAFNRDGEAAFSFDILEFCDKSQLLLREQYWLDTVRPFDDRIGYNTSLRADAGPVLVYNDEMRAAISARFKGKKKSKEHKRRISEAHKQKLYSAETRKKISDGMKTFYSDPKNREAQSKRFMGRPSPLRGVPMSEEQKRKLSEIRKGKPNLKGRTHSDETIKQWLELRRGGVSLTNLSYDTRVAQAVISNCIKRYLKEHPEELPAPSTSMNPPGKMHGRSDVTGKSEAMDLSVACGARDVPD